MAECQIATRELPVTMLGNRPIANVRINGTDVRLMVDSGAFFSFLTEAAAQQLELPVVRAPRGMRIFGLTGSVDARMTTVARLQLSKGEMRDVQFIVGGNEPGGGAMGLLGRNLLGAGDTEYDLGHGTIRFITRGSDCDGQRLAYWAGDQPTSELPLTDSRSKWSAVTATAQLNGHDVRALFDTGATTVLSLDAARRVGVAEADMKATVPMRGLGHGETPSWIAPIRQFELGTEVDENNRLRIADFDLVDAEMLLGIDFFLSHRIYVSQSRQRMAFTYNGGPVFALNDRALNDPASSDRALNPGATTDAPSTGAATAPPAVPDTAPLADAASYARRGAASAARLDLVHALADLDRACEMAPQVADYFTRRGVVHEASNQMPAARLDFDTALRPDPAQTEALLHRAWLRSIAGERDGALADLRSLDKTLAPQAHLRLSVAGLYTRMALPDLALPQLTLWIASHANEANLDSVLNARCRTRAMLGVELDQAIDDCDQALAQQPKNAAFLDSRGWVRLRQGRWRDAVDDYDRSLEIKPDNAWPLYGRGIARARLGDAAPALADIDAARRLLPSIDAEAGRYGWAVDRLPAASPL